MDDLEPQRMTPARVIAASPPASSLAADGVARLQQPRAHVRMETLWVDRGQGLRQELCEIRAPVIALSFVYEGFCVRASQEGDRIFCARDGALQTMTRNRAAETQARLELEGFGAVELELLEDYAKAPDCDADYVVQPEADAQAHCAFVASALPQLRALGWDVQLDSDFPYRVVPDPQWFLRIEPAEDKPDWFGLELGVEIGGHCVDLLPVLLSMLEHGDKAKDFARIEHNGPRFVALPGDAGYLEVPAAHFRTLARVLAELYHGTDASIRFPGVRAAAILELDQVFGRSGRALRFEGRAAYGFRQRAFALAGTDSPPALPPVAELRATLRPYQEAGLAWLQRLRAAGAGGVLADDMGLGKTLQTIAHLCAEKASGRCELPSLVIAPTSVVSNWRRELERFAPHLSLTLMYGPERRHARAAIVHSDVVLTSYAVLLRDADLLCEQPFACVVLDEAQAIKNPRSRAAQLAKNLSAEQRICLSGTPIENNLHELWSLFDVAVPGLLGSEEQFRHFYRIPIEQERNNERLLALRSQVAPYLLRRMKEQVASELPQKTEVIVPVELRGRQRELYESIRIAAHEKVRAALRKQGIAQSTVTILGALTRLRQLCCDPRLVPGQQARETPESAKYERLLELLREQRERGRCVLVFSQFTSMLQLISHGLGEQGVAHALLTGATQDRERQVRAFQNGEVDFFLISLKAGGTGLNLTRADTVVHYDPWWNPAAQDQATDRAHRIGQDKPVFVHRLIVAGSVEERMLGLQRRKRLLAGAVIAAPEPSAQPLGEAEVEHLLAPLDE